MESIEVIARFDQEGIASPLSFTWQGKNFPINSIGRRWEDAEGQHILVMVMVPAERVYELVFIPSVGRWYLGRFGMERRMA
jgi:hypothetical protein